MSTLQSSRRNPIGGQYLWPARLAAVAMLMLSGWANAQEIRYSWVDLSYLYQDMEGNGTQVPIPGQTVDLSASDGSGIRFRGSIEVFEHLYIFGSYASTDNDVAAVVTNIQGMFPATDEYDHTTIRGGIGIKFNVFGRTDIFGEASYDSLDLDFGSFAGEDFDTDTKEFGGSLGLRSLLNDDLEVRVYGRYSGAGLPDLNTGDFDTDVLFGAGFGWEIVRGLSIVGDYEAGDISNWSLGFRLDLDED